MSIGTRALIFVFAGLMAYPLINCTGGGGGGGTSSQTSNSISLSWAANHEKAVNSPGGGYVVLYSSSPIFSSSAATRVDVPYVSGATAPTSVVIPNVSAGLYYVRIYAYSALNPSGGEESMEIAVSTTVGG